MLTKINTLDIIEDVMKRFLRYTDSSFIDVYISENVLYMVVESTEESAVYPCVVQEQIDYEHDEFIRVDRKKFTKLLLKGSIAFEIENQITIYFYDDYGVNVYSLQIPRQTMDKRAVKESVDIVLQTQDFSPIDNSSGLNLARIARNLRTPVSIRDGLGFTQSPSVSVYCKVATNNFNLSADTFYKLSAERGQLYDIGNKLVLMADNGVCYIARKIRTYACHDFETVVKAKPTHFISANFTALISLIKKAELDVGDVIVDFNSGQVEIADAEYKYKTYIQVSKIESIATKKKEALIASGDLRALLKANENSAINTDKYGLKRIKFNSDVVKKVLPVLPNASAVDLFVKKSFIVLKSKNIFVVFRKEEIE